MGAIGSASIEVLLQFASNAAHRRSVHRALKPGGLLKHAAKSEVHGDCAGAFAARLLQCQLVGSAQRLESIDELLSNGFAAELEAALRAAIDGSEYPPGSCVRPMVPKIAKLLRRLAKHGFANHLSRPHVVMLLANAARRESNNVVAETMGHQDNTAEARRALKAILTATATEPKSMFFELVALGHSDHIDVREYDSSGTLEGLDVTRLCAALGVEMEDSDDEECITMWLISSRNACPVCAARAVCL